MSHQEIISLIGYVALGVGVLSYILKKQNHAKSVSGLSSFIWFIDLYLIGAFTASALQLLLALRTWASMIFHKKSHRHALFMVTFSAIIIFTFVTWQGYKSLIPLVASLISTIAFCYMNNENMRKMMVATSAFWLLNGLVWDSNSQMITELMKIIINVYMINHWTRKGEFTNNTTQTVKTTVEMTREDYEFENKIRKQFES